MQTKLELRCSRCGPLACKVEPGAAEPPEYCPATTSDALLAEVRALYASDAQTRALAVHAARTESAGYCRQPRVEEIAALAHRMGASHLGIACCVGTLREAVLAQEIFEAQGLRVSTVCCKVGSIPKEELGLTEAEKIRPGQFEALCNPIAQARLLERAGTQLNVVVGLCVGHDSLFFRHSRAPTTVLLAKDRVTGHNPAAALYTSRSYYRRLRQPSGHEDDQGRGES
jgi:uncharacterized metal-binding protein